MTEANPLLDETWKDDLLKRREDAEFLERFLVGRTEQRRAAGKSGGYVLEIDAGWGTGKTFFIERFAKQLRASGHLVVEVNAWKDDATDDPFVAVLASIDTVFKPFKEKKAKQFRARWETVKKKAAPVALRALKGGLQAASKRYFAQELDELLGDGNPNTSTVTEDVVEAAGGEIGKFFDRTLEAQIDAHSKARQGTEDFRTSLAATVAALPEGKKPPLFVLVDELDRCRPSYAMSLLERVKHLFEVDGVVFVFATNSDQLRHSVAGAYGSGFDGYRYLKRFFDQTYVFEEPDRETFVAEALSRLPLDRMRSPCDSVPEFFTRVAAAYDMDLREIQHVINILDAVASTWEHERMPIELVLLLPMAISFYRTGDPIRAAAIEGDGAIPKRLKITRFTRSPIVGRAKEEFDFRNAFQIFVQRYHSLEKMMQLGADRNAEWSQTYVVESVRFETGGQLVGDRPSVNSTLSGLVSKAGRLTASKP